MRQWVFIRDALYELFFSIHCGSLLLSNAVRIKASFLECLCNGTEFDTVSQVEDEGDNILDQLAMKRTWESGNHPFLFFNEDGETFSPLGFFVDDQGNNNTRTIRCNNIFVSLLQQCSCVKLDILLFNNPCEKF